MKRLADLLTASRFLISTGIMSLGLWRGRETWPTVIMMALLAWMTDALDGPLARRARSRRTTWIGEQDFAVDVFMVMALLCYLTATHVVPWQGSLTYLAVAGVAICVFREQAITMAFMVPVDGLFLYTGLRRAPTETRFVLLYLTLLLVLDWHHFCCLVSVFLSGMRRALRV